MEGYTASVSGSAAEGYVVTNTHEPSKPEPKPEPKPVLPQTGDDSLPTATAEVLAATGAAVLLAGLSLRLSRRRREN